ncbi:hypothetical protein SAY87_028447 [Trapa incisa]|uniref:Protein kinase domain-containing protein n=1 Tax=Trapa incisa TaxID=236973 RepID=A0AAN7KPB1_9MYRT|nr:hypothetical protein SAY87_028447 [Trapa incisa]
MNMHAVLIFLSLISSLLLCSGVPFSYILLPPALQPGLLSRSEGPSENECYKKCMDPLTSTPFGSPCGCVLPMKVRLLFGVALYAVFPRMSELEIEIAAVTYLEQSQVKIMAAIADTQNQERTVVDINLVPLGEKFDNTTADLIYKRFCHKKVPFNSSLFGQYEVIYITYTGIPSPPLFRGYTGSGPTENGEDFPIMAKFHKNDNINVKTIAIISLSAFVLLLIVIGAFSAFLKWKRFGRPSRAVGPGFTSSINKRSGIGSMLLSSIASSASGSLVSSMAPCMLSIRAFGLAELEKATDKFNLKRILGEGGFGRVYRGVMEDGIEVAVKLLTRDHHNGD